MKKWATIIILFGILTLFPWLANNYILSIFIFALYIAYVGQAWNLLFGYGGQLSLGHSLYTGLAAYLSVGLFVHYNFPFWFSLICIPLVVGLLGGLIMLIAARFRMQGVYFTLLTIVCAESARILFEHWKFFGANGGIFISHINFSPISFYYIFLTLTLLSIYICQIFLKTKFGYLCLAIREDEQVAESLGVNTLYTKTILMGYSAFLSSIGGIIYGFYQGSLFPDQVFSLSYSIDIAMGCIVGGIGTVFGPLLGAFILIPLGEILNILTNNALSGIKPLFYGISIFLIVRYMPKGIEPFIQKKLNKG